MKLPPGWTKKQADEGSLVSNDERGLKPCVNCGPTIGDQGSLVSNDERGLKLFIEQPKADPERGSLVSNDERGLKQARLRPPY